MLLVVLRSYVVEEPTHSFTMTDRHHHHPLRRHHRYLLPSSLFLLLLLSLSFSFNNAQQQQQRQPHPALQRKIRLANDLMTHKLDLYFVDAQTAEQQLVQPSIDQGLKIKLDTYVGVQFAVQVDSCRSSTNNNQEGLCEKLYFTVSEQNRQIITISMITTDNEQEEEPPQRITIDFWDNAIQTLRDSNDPIKICQANAKAALHSLPFASNLYYETNERLLHCDMAHHNMKQDTPNEEPTSCNATFSLDTVLDNHLRRPSLNHRLPRWEEERQRLTWELLVSLIVVWCTILYLNLWQSTPSTKSLLEEGADSNFHSNPSIEKSNNNNSKSSKRKKGHHHGQSNNNSNKTKPKKESTSFSTHRHSVFITMLSLFVQLFFGSITTLFGMLLVRSSSNWELGRGVYQVPVLHPSETQQLLQVLTRVAARNMVDAFGGGVDYDEVPLVWPPYGWQKMRHKGYPTTDLNTLTDPFTTSEQRWMADLLNRRLAPTISRLYGIPSASIRAHDLFFVRYDGDKQARLNRHIDASDISFNLVLTEDFDSGGTRFWNHARDTSFAHVQPKTAGTALIHKGRLFHEGVDVTRGTRIILVGFLHLDDKRAFRRSSTSTGMSLFASWFDWTWMTMKLRRIFEQSEYDTRGNPTWYAKNMDRASTILGFVLDCVLRHHYVNLEVDDTEAYLQALDCAFEENKLQNHTALNPLWFRGQNLMDDTWPRIEEDI